MRLIVSLLLLVRLPVSAADISRLTWLAGCWAYDGEESGS
jgi:hypothetical protein